MKKPQKTTTMKVIKTTEGKLRLISYKEANYDEALTARIQDRMAEANYLEMTGTDWKAIYRNTTRMYPQGNPTDAEIDNEIEIFYEA